ncbi:MAG TPA: GAF domain-containing protein [Anaerolineaceae bacterium]
MFQAAAEEDFFESTTPDVDVVVCADSSDGFDVLRLKSSLVQRGLDLPVIAISDRRNEQRAADCLRQGVSDYLYTDQRLRLACVINRVLESERKKAERELVVREHQLQQIIQQMPLPIAIGDVHGDLQFINNAFLDMFGITRGEQFLKTFNPLTNPFVVAKGIDAGVRQVIRGDTIRIPEIELNPDPNWNALCGRGFSSRIYTDLTIFPVVNEAGEVWQMVSIWNDVTERRRSELEMVRRLAELQALQLIALAGAEATSLIELVDRVGEVVGGKLYPDSFGIALIDDAKGVLNCHLVSRLLEVAEKFPLRLTQGITGAVARSGHPRRVADVHADPDYITRYPEVQSELCVPITHGDQVIGVIDVEAVSLNAFSDADERFMGTVAGELGMAIEKLRLLETERIRNEELEALAQVSAAVRAANTRTEMLPAVIDRMAQALEAQGAAIAFTNPEDGSLDFAITMGESSELDGLRIPAGIGFGAQVLRSQEYAICLDARSDPRVYRGDLIAENRSLLCMPVIAEGESIGLFYLMRSAAFDPSDVRLCQSMVDIFASAVYRVELQERTHNQLQRLTSLRMVDESILSSLDLSHTLGVLHEQITGSLQVDDAAFFLYDPSTELLHLDTDHGIYQFLRREVLLQMGESHAGKVALERKMDYIADLSLLHDSLTEKLEEVEDPFTSYLGIPLVSKGNLKGVLELFKRSPIDLNSDWMNYLDALAGQAAIAIDNAQLFHEQQKTNERLVHAYDATLDGWSHALDLRDKETEGHSHRVTELTLSLARQLRVPEDLMPHIRRGAQLHDIGKMGIPDSILLKPGPLTEDEWAVMRQHPIYAADLLYPIDFLQPALDIPYCHHEKWDGSGYPQGLKEKEIPLAARIFAVVDVWDALTSNRSYRPAWSATQALKYIREQSGKHFDPQVVDCFLELIDAYVGRPVTNSREYRYVAMDD